MNRFFLLFLLVGCGEVGPAYTRGDLCAERAQILSDYAADCDLADDIDRMTECCSGAECDVYPSPDEYTVAAANLEQCSLCLESDGCAYSCDEFPGALPLPCEVAP